MEALSLWERSSLIHCLGRVAPTSSAAVFNLRLVATTSASIASWNASWKISMSLNISEADWAAASNTPLIFGPTMTSGASGCSNSNPWAAPGEVCCTHRECDGDHHIQGQDQPPPPARVWTCPTNPKAASQRRAFSERTAREGRRAQGQLIVPSISFAPPSVGVFDLLSFRTAGILCPLVPMRPQHYPH